MQKEVKIINFKATKFGVFQALELDFDKFKDGVIAIKGNAGAGKSTIQKGVKLSTQGRNTLVDSEQYGEAWEMETQLVDGAHNIFISAVKKEGKAIKYNLYEKDAEGKKVNNPVIDGYKATPAKYMELIATELTFGINEFLSEDNTTHKKFMFKLFRPELEKLGVIFDKKAANYENSILGELDTLTYDRDKLRSECTHRGAFITDFERQGVNIDAYENKERIDIESLEEKRNNLLIDKGQSEGNAKAEFEKKKSEIIAKGQKITDEIRVLSDDKLSDYASKQAIRKEWDSKFNHDKAKIEKIRATINEILFLKSGNTEVYIKSLVADFRNIYENSPGVYAKPICPVIENGILKNDDTITYEPGFLPLIEKAKSVRQEYASLNLAAIDLSEFDKKIEAIDKEITSAKVTNDLIERMELNQKWIKACALVTAKRGELAKLYAGVDTGVKGLKMKPFFKDDEKIEIKTIYTGDYDDEFFKNDGTDERLLVSYSSTQRPIIGILLQVARLKLKSKALKYIFLDDVPMDKKSREVITKIAADNGMTIITSLTGDFDKEKLTENELLVEGGEVFFND